MTKEKAQIVIGNIPIKPEVLDDCYDITEYQEAKAMAIEALEQESITWIVGKDNCQVAVRNMPIDKMLKICAIIGEEEQQPCEDCVSRAELNALYAENRPYLATRVSEFGDKLEKLPSVQPVRSKGYWIERTFPYMIHDYKCSECGETIEAIAKSNFCPNCGADMRGEE